MLHKNLKRDMENYVKSLDEEHHRRYKFTFLHERNALTFTVGMPRARRRRKNLNAFSRSELEQIEGFHHEISMRFSLNRTEYTTTKDQVYGKFVG